MTTCRSEWPRRRNPWRTLALLMILPALLAPGCNDKGDDPPRQPAAPVNTIVVPGANPDLDNVVQVDVMDDTAWGVVSQTLVERLDWTWDLSRRELVLSNALDYPLFVRVTGFVRTPAADDYYALTTWVAQNGAAVAANEITSLISATALNDGVSVDVAARIVAELLDLRGQDPFAPVPAKDRPARITAAMQALEPSYRADDEAGAQQKAVDSADLLIAGFASDVLTGEAPLDVQFTNLSVGRTTDYLWDFDDGTLSADTDPVHTFAAGGRYEVALTVTGLGGTATAVTVITVTQPVFDPPVAAATADRTYGDVPLTIDFSDASSGIVDDYLWDFGDGATSTQPNPTHTFATAGRYTVRLTVTGPGGTDDTALSLAAGRFTAIVPTAATDYSSGAHTVVPVDTLAAQTDLLPTTSDIALAAYGEHFYRIERYMHDNVTKFHVDRPDQVIWQYSTLDAGEVSSNPHTLVFVNASKAYLIRYGSDTAWIVNPAATVEADFKTGELDLSAYGDQDGLPEMAGGVVVDGRLFMVLQRLNRFAPSGVWEPNTAYVAVFDTQSDAEIDTGMDPVLGGIPLPVEDPLTIQYLEPNRTIYVQGVGSYPFPGVPGTYSGGIVAIDPQTFAVSMVLDDGSAGDAPYGNISGMAVVTPEKGYFTGYTNWGDNTVYGFNPATGAVTGAIESLRNKNIALEQRAVDDRGRLWVADRSAGGVAVIDPATDSRIDLIPTGLPPLGVEFCIQE